MKAIEPRNIAVGKGSILVNNEEFVNGYQAGHLACSLDCRAVVAGRYQMTDETIAAVLMEQLENANCSEQYNVGYCVGWIATFATKDNTT